MKKIIIDKNYLIEEYINKQKSSTKIAEQLNCSYMTILQKLKEFGIPARKDGIKYPQLTRQYLYDEYVIKNKNATEIGRENKCPQTAIQRRLKKYNIPTKKPILSQYGNWSVLRAGKDTCFCTCSCGKEFEVSIKNLKNGTSTCCRYCTRTKHVGIKHCKWKGYKEISGTAWYRIKESARKRGCKCEVSIEYIWNLYESQNRKCKLSGLQITFSNSTKITNTTASLDRIDSSKGYTEDNVQWVHKEINNIKTNCDQKRFIELCKLVANHIL